MVADGGCLRQPEMVTVAIKESVVVGAVDESERGEFAMIACMRAREMRL